MRGKVARRVLYARAIGITPAHAGKSPGIGTAQHQRRDHPRPCGEKLARPFQPYDARGSPPPMRGKGLEPVGGKSGDRITPAHAGKSSLHRRRAQMCRDHPRPCGEKLSAICVEYAALGSPPPMRGKEIASRIASQIPRITPAHAGKRRY